MKLVVVTASLEPKRTEDFWTSWGDAPTVMVSSGPVDPIYLSPRIEHVLSPSLLPVVPAFLLGIARAPSLGADLVACLHDDVRIDDPLWAAKVVSFFEEHRACGLLGFGGATSLGSDDIYDAPYNPMQLARGGFVSNMEQAEAHGARSYEPVRVACLDGFSQIGRAQHMLGWYGYLAAKGARHHAFDSWLGCLAKRTGFEAWMLPIRVHHHGGMTAVAFEPYQKWAKTQHPAGDQGFWEEAHRLMYEDCRWELPLRVR